MKLLSKSTSWLAIVVILAALPASIAVGQSQSPDNAVVTAAVGVMAAVESDEFAGANLATPRWTFVNPVGAGSVTLAAGQLLLTVPSGASHNPWEFNRAVRIMQTVTDGDLALEAKFTSLPTLTNQMQGLAVEQDLDNWLHFSVQHNGQTQQAVAVVTLAGVSTVKGIMPLVATDALWLRVAQQGDEWHFSFSRDGQQWQRVVSFRQPLTVSAVGPTVANHAVTGSAPAFTAKVDYVRNLLATGSIAGAAVGPDTQGPLVHSVQKYPNATGLTIRWHTDEQSNGVVEYGNSRAYGATTVAIGDGYTHEATLAGLTANQTYHYRIVALDSAANSTTSADSQLTFVPNVGATPTLDIWYGNQQNVGLQGKTQMWANVLGNVANPADITSLRYKLNNEASTALTIGPDGRRLTNAGDFNVDLTTVNLQTGANTLAITAVDKFNNTTVQTVTITYQPTSINLPYSINWNSLANIGEIQNVAHVIDGKWRLENGAVRTVETGYDRLIGIGDVTWQDYEILAPVTIHSLPISDYGVGFLLRWSGHTTYPLDKCGQSDRQPRCGYVPIGALTWYRGNQLRIFGTVYNPTTQDYDTQPLVGKAKAITTGVAYWFKARVETNGSNSTYYMKVWQVGQNEPTAWDVSAQADAVSLTTGSVLLLSHRADVSFGAVTVTPLGADTVPPVITLLGANPLVLTVGASYTDPGATATDNMDGNISNRIVVGGGPVDTSRAGVYTVTYDVTDLSGNAALQQRRIVQVGNAPDTVAPVITLLGANPLVLEAGVTYVEPGATATDNVDGDLTDQIVVGGDLVNHTQVNQYTVTYDVTDQSGNPAIQRQRTVDVVDTTPPTLTLLGANPLFVTMSSEYRDPGATATDFVDGDVTNRIVNGGDTVNINQAGTYHVSYTVTDRTGNQAPFQVRSVTVLEKDSVKPVIVLLGANPLTWNAGATYVDPGAVAADDIDGDLTPNIVVAGDKVEVIRPGSYTITYDVADAAGNQAEQKQRTVTVIDTTPPTITLLGSNPLSLVVGQTYKEPGYVVEDNVDVNLAAKVTVAGAVDHTKVGEYTLVYRVADLSGNQAQAVTRRVNVHIQGNAFQVYLPTIQQP